MPLRSSRLQKHQKIISKPDGVLTFRSPVFGHPVQHQSPEEDQPVHLQSGCRAAEVRNTMSSAARRRATVRPAFMNGWTPKAMRQPIRRQGYCVSSSTQNCVTAKTTDIKDPNQNINWVPPLEGGEGASLPPEHVVQGPARERYRFRFRSDAPPSKRYFARPGGVRRLKDPKARQFRPYGGVYLPLLATQGR